MDLELSPEIRKALEGIGFIERYSDLSKEYSFDLDDSFEDYSNEKVLGVINELGYNARYYKGEDFFKIVDKHPPYKFNLNLRFKYGVVEFVWSIWKDDEIQIGMPWGFLKDLLDGKDERVSKPIFRNYDDLKEILTKAFSMYEDFKRKLIATGDI